MAYKNLVASIINCLTQLLDQDDLSADSRESLEVSIQCLQSAYSIPPTETKTNFDILKLYNKTKNDSTKPISTPEATLEAKAEAERLKNEGNELIKKEMYNEALANYTKAIELDGRNAVFYCNRAAVYSKLGNHHQAIKDCNTALTIDPSYSKAYGRLGLAYSSLNNYKEAKECYQKALNLEPDNESLRNNLRIAEEKFNQLNNGALGNTSNPSGMDLSSLLSNPALMNMARQMLTDPMMQNVVSDLMSGNVEQGGRMDALIEAGQHLAQQMQNSNPDLIESLRRQMGRNPNDPEPPARNDQ